MPSRTRGASGLWALILTAIVILVAAHRSVAEDHSNTILSNDTYVPRMGWLGWDTVSAIGLTNDRRALLTGFVNGATPRNLIFWHDGEPVWHSASGDGKPWLHDPRLSSSGKLLGMVTTPNDETRTLSLISSDGWRVLVAPGDLDAEGTPICELGARHSNWAISPGGVIAFEGRTYRDGACADSRIYLMDGDRAQPLDLSRHDAPEFGEWIDLLAVTDSREVVLSIVHQAAQGERSTHEIVVAGATGSRLLLAAPQGEIGRVSASTSGLIAVNGRDLRRIGLRGTEILFHTTYRDYPRRGDQRLYEHSPINARGDVAATVSTIGDEHPAAHLFTAQGQTIILDNAQALALNDEGDLLLRRWRRKHDGAEHAILVLRRANGSERRLLSTDDRLADGVRFLTDGLSGSLVLGDDGRVTTRATSTDKVGLLCLSPNEMTLIAKEGDTGPSGELFSSIGQSATRDDGTVLFAAEYCNRVTGGSAYREQQIYVASEVGVDSLVRPGQVASDGTPIAEITTGFDGRAPTFAINRRGSVLVRGRSPAHETLFLRRGDGSIERIPVRAGGNSRGYSHDCRPRDHFFDSGPDGSNRSDGFLDVYRIDGIALGDNDEVVIAAHSSRETLLVAVWSSDTWTFVLAPEDHSLPESPYDLVHDLFIAGDQVVFSAGGTYRHPLHTISASLSDATRSDGKIALTEIYHGLQILDFLNPGLALLAASSGNDRFITNDAGLETIDPDVVAINARNNRLFANSEGVVLTGPTPEVACPAPPTVDVPPLPTFTPWPTATPPETILRGNTTAALPGSETQLELRLSSIASVAGVQTDIVFSPEVSIAARPSGRPDCTVNGGLSKSLFSNFIPAGCDPATECDRARFVLLSFESVDPIPSDSLLFSCRVIVSADAGGGDHLLALEDFVASDSAGNAVAGDTEAPRVQVVHASSADASAGLQGNDTASGCQLGAAGAPTWMGLVAPFLVLVAMRRSNPSS